MQPNEYQSVRDLSAHFNVSVPTIWLWAKNGNLPRPVKLSRQVVRWNRATIEAWEESRRVPANSVAQVKEAM